MKLKIGFNSKICLSLLISLIVFSSFGCDSGINYIPKEWTKIDEHHYSKTFESFDLEMSQLGGLNHHDLLLPTLTIRNRTNLPIVILNANIKANNSEYTAKPWGQDSWETVPLNETRTTTMVFELNKSIRFVLKDPVELNLTIRVGNEINQVNIPMVKKYG